MYLRKKNFNNLDGRSVVTDNFFTSVSLSRKLLAQKITLIGTVRHNRGEVPLSFIGKPNIIMQSSFGIIYCFS